jgi:hypothetical protein
LNQRIAGRSRSYDAYIARASSTPGSVSTVHSSVQKTTSGVPENLTDYRDPYWHCRLEGSKCSEFEVTGKNQRFPFMVINHNLNSFLICYDSRHILCIVKRADSDTEFVENMLAMAVVACKCTICPPFVFLLSQISEICSQSPEESRLEQAYPNRLQQEIDRSHR